MKKMFAMVLTLSLILCSMSTLAEGDMGVQVIGGPDGSTELVSLDDIKIGSEAEIPGYAILYPTEFAFVDKIGYYNEGHYSVDYDYRCNAAYTGSGNDAEYACLRLDITNTARASKDFLAAFEVKVVFDDTYEYAGWIRQLNYNNGTCTDSGVDQADKGKQNTRWFIQKADAFSIDPMYQGHYMVNCTLPNAVVNSKKPLRMVFTLDGNEITYNIRK